METIKNKRDWHVALVWGKRFYGVDVLHVNERTFVSMKRTGRCICIALFDVFYGVSVDCIS